MPARAIVVLERVDGPTGSQTYRYLLRADVPASRQVKFAQPSYVSPFQPMAPDTDPDATALTTGAVVEQVGEWAVSPDVALAAVQAGLIQQQQAYQARVTNDKTYARYGTYYDGAWHAQGA